jgi:hypothetical protein
MTVESSMYRTVSLLLLGVGIGALSACTTSEVLVAHSVELVPAQQTIAENELLDVGVVVFDPGVPEGEVDKEVLEELLEDGTFVHVRRAESMYMAVELRNTMQSSGYWGGVWVTPETSSAPDLNVTARIVHSDGDQVRVDVVAVDATGRVWIDKPYELETAAGAYNRQRYPDLDPYQDMFNSIANDLAEVRTRFSDADVREIRTVGALRYASELSPAAFAGYVEEDRSGTYAPVRLPAVDDPMFERTQRIRQREHLFFETLDQHYEKFSVDASQSYDSWREYAREEAIAIRELQRSARWRTGIGIATILASIVYGADSNNDSFSNRLVRDAMMYVGADMLQTSAVRRQEKRLHTETLEELSTSFDDEVAPLVVEVAGVQHRLTGTAELQYAEWRDLLQQLFITETGFVPEDMEIYAEPEPQPAETPAVTPVLEEVQVPATGQGAAQESSSDADRSGASGGSASGA